MTDRRLDWLVALTSAWMVGGAWLDVWWHHQSAVESFSTPAHGFPPTGSVLPAGGASLALVLIVLEPRPAIATGL